MRTTREQIETFQEAYRRQMLSRPGFADEFQDKLQELLEPDSVSSLVLSDPPLQPVFMDRNKIACTERALCVVSNCISKILEHRYGFDTVKLCEEMSLNERERRFLHLSARDWRWKILWRPDFIESGGRLKVIELNIGSAVGFMVESALWRRLYLSLDGMMELIPQLTSYNADGSFAVHDAVVEAYKTFFAGKEEQPTVALGLHRGAEAREGRKFAFLERILNSSGRKTLLVYSDELEVGDKVRKNGNIIDIFLNFTLEKSLETWRNVHIPSLLGKIFFFAGYVEFLFENKHWLALLSDVDRHPFLTGREKAVLESTLVWTRDIEEQRTKRMDKEIDLIPHIVENKDEFVIKPAFGSSGFGIVFGVETPRAEWECIINDYLKREVEIGIVQEYVPLKEVNLPFCRKGDVCWRRCLIDFGLFFINGSVPFGVARLKESGSADEKITNEFRGGKNTWLAIV